MRLLLAIARHTVTGTYPEPTAVIIFYARDAPVAGVREFSAVVVS